MKLMMMTFITTTLLGLIVVAGVFTWYRSQLSPVENDAPEVTFEIAPGLSSAEIADRLEEEELINSAFAFRVYGHFSNSLSNIIAGTYQLSPAMSTQEIVARLTDGEISRQVIQIIGGMNVAQITDAFIENGHDEEDILDALSREYQSSILRDKPSDQSLEGYLFPDTYFAAPDATVADIIEIILTNTEEKISSEIIDDWRARDLNIHEGLTLASIIQRESPREDMADISGVFWNRLEAEQRLESDATVNYVLGTSRPQSTLEDLEVQSPYNTYRNEGLPPGPISSPEIDAIIASARPADHEWFYFLNTREGDTLFSRTFEEHDRKRIEFLDS